MRGNANQVKVHFKGSDDDYIVFVESAKDVRDWRGDRTIPLAQVVNGWKIFVTHKQGTTGILDTASNGQLDGEFGTHKEEEVVKLILEKGDILETENSARNGDRNMTQGPAINH